MKKVLLIIAALIIIGSGAFYGGMKYAESKNSTVNSANNFRNFQNLSPEERQKQIEQMGGVRTGTNKQSGSGVASGEIISKDDKSIIVKLRDGGSKIVFFSDKTQISKMEAGLQSDIVVGEQVAASGSTNSDGSITANTIQLRPPLPPATSGNPASLVK